MLKSLALAVAAIAVTVSAADLAGTWKFNAAKSKYTGMAAPKEMTVTYTMQGSGWNYAAKGVSATGEPISRASSPHGRPCCAATRRQSVRAGPCRPQPR